jgi:hypothetical protein
VADKPAVVADKPAVVADKLRNVSRMTGFSEYLLMEDLPQASAGQI